ncbi:hypothetical protein Rhopal_006692-T1 [Rhodotorula paludigena]|uniref:CBF1-interacting co-repressor CIR N-terminal domain-containing protein n=1 Tax=Rhodotorula paludigena TaxID=86838 RepID=A0AAV5GM00_9BASI|nr:hypothetical protein Rhopal_006692-T1 [Rhodotorula paludigena]
MPFKGFEMGAKTWQHPEVHRRWVEEEKAKAAEQKKQKDEAKLAKEVEKEQRKLLQKQLAADKLLDKERKEDEYLAKLKADVARLEAKRMGPQPNKIAAYNKERVIKQAEEREKEAEKEVKLTAAEMLKLREKKLEDKKKAQFWRLNDADRHMLELMSPGERVEYGFGPYEEDELEYEPELQQRFSSLGLGTTSANKAHTADKLRKFIFTPGVTAAFEPISLALPLEGVPDLSTLSAEDKATVQLIVQEETQRLREELAKYAIEEFGANALLQFETSGAVPVEDEAQLQAGILYEIRGQGIPARLASSKPHLRAQRPSQYTRFAAAAHPSPSAGGGRGWQGFGGAAAAGGGGGWGANAYEANGGAGWRDPPLFGDHAQRDGWGPTAGGAGGGSGWDAWTGGAVAGGGAQHGWGATGLPGGWNASATERQDGGAFWHGLPNRAPRARQPHGIHAQAPAALRNLPWGAQQYVKRMREQQEREERELAAAAAAGGAAAGFPGAAAGFTAPLASQTPKVPFATEDPALFGNAFPRPSYPLSPVAPSLRAVPAPPPAQTGATGWGSPLANGQAAAAAAQHAQQPGMAETRPVATTDPDNGGVGVGGGGSGGGSGGLAGWFGWGKAAPAPAPAPAAAAPVAQAPASSAQPQAQVGGADWKMGQAW